MTLSPVAIAARVGAWLLALITTFTGIGFITTVTAVKWTSNGDGSDTGEPYDIVGVGTGLLCVGLLVLAALLLLEGYGPKRSIGSGAAIDSGSTPDA